MSDAGDPAADMDTAIDIIKIEHKALGEVLSLLQHILRNIDAGTSPVDFELLSLALYYIDDFPCRCHHPKEERYLFPAVRRHTARFDEVLHRLDTEHAADEQRVRDLHRALVRYQAGAPEGLARLRSSVDMYAAMTYEHMRKEESLLDQLGGVLPQAEWRALAEHLAREQEPLLGARGRGEFGRLRERIENLLPTKLRTRGYKGA